MGGILPDKDALFSVKLWAVSGSSAKSIGLAIF
jgi:hypothetical protein